jgi:hypothetical protein
VQHSIATSPVREFPPAVTSASFSILFNNLQLNKSNPRSSFKGHGEENKMEKLRQMYVMHLKFARMNYNLS